MRMQEIGKERLKIGGQMPKFAALRSTGHFGGKKSIHFAILEGSDHFATRVAVL